MSSIDSKLSQYAIPMWQSPPMLPEATAPPAQVRTFISHLLQQREIPEYDIQNVVTRWRIGSGREMRAYDPSMYIDVFGAEYGWIIYRDVKLRIHEEKCLKVTYKYQTEISALALAIFTASMVYVWFCEVGELVLSVAIYGGIFGGLGLIVAVGAMLIAKTPEDKIEASLRECRSECVAKKD